MKSKNSLMNITIIVIVAKGIAFLKEFVLAYFFGVSEISDAYNIAYTIPITLLGFLATAINTSYIPIFSRVTTERGEEEAHKFSNALLSVIFIVSTCTFIIIEIFTQPLVNLFASGFNEHVEELTVYLMRHMGIAVFLIAYNSLMSAFVQLKNKYYMVAFSNAFLYIMSIVGIVLAFTWRIEFISWGVVAGYLVEAIVLTKVAIEQGYHIGFGNPRNEHIRQVIELVVPIMFGSLASEINTIVDKTIASSFQVGSVSVLSYAHKIDAAVVSIFVTSIVQLAYPKISKAVNESRISYIREQMREDVSFLIALTLPIMLFAFVFSKEITDFLFLRGAFIASDSEIVAIALQIYIIALIPTSMRKYLVRIYYSFGDSKTPASNSVFVIATNIIFSIILSRFFGIYGVALGSSISITFGVIRLIVKVKKYVHFEYAEYIGNFVRLAGCGTIMILVSKSCQMLLQHYISSNLLLVLCAGVSLIIYYICMRLLKVDSILDYAKK